MPLLDKLAPGVRPNHRHIYHGDCIEIMATWPDHCVDCVFADPPYNLQLRKGLTRPEGTPANGVSDGWDRFADFAAYDDFTRQWLGQVQRLLKPRGSVWVIGSYHNIFRIGTCLQDLGFWLLNDVIWLKPNPMPNFKGTRLTNAHETLIWAAPSGTSRPQFHYWEMKNLNGGRQMRSDWRLPEGDAWDIPLCTRGERLTDEDGRKVHATQKPAALLYRVIQAATTPGQVILDPFFGTGTTGFVAEALGRRWIGIEREQTYLTAALARLKQAPPTPAADWIAPTQTRKPPRVPIGVLVEGGWLGIGQTLFDRSGQPRARLCSDGTVQTGPTPQTKQKEGRRSPVPVIRGSIHAVGARLQNHETCNGWTFWQVQDPRAPGRLVSLATVRARFLRQTHPEHPENLAEPTLPFDEVDLFRPNG
ncbi:MAG: DNA methyltransferase [Pseudomonadota bacterium]